MKITKTVFGQSKVILNDDATRDDFDHCIRAFALITDSLNIEDNSIIHVEHGNECIFEFGYSDRFSYDNFIIDLED